MRRILIPIFILGFTGLLFAADVFSNASAQPGANQVVLNWITKSESDVQRFIIERSNDGGDTYYSLHSIGAKGPGNLYEYVDINVMFKDYSAIFYKIKAVSPNGSVLDEEFLIAGQNISGIFQTWGAIKALFR